MAALPTLEVDDLPDVETFPAFQCLAADGQTTRDPDTGSRAVTEYVFSPKRWANVLDRSTRQFNNPPSPGGTTSRRQPPAWTLERILSQDIQDWTCVQCGIRGNDCLGAQCVEDFRQNSRNALESLEIRDTIRMRFGVYCRGNAMIPAGSILGEYIGELLPPETDVNEVLRDDVYGFGVPGIGYVTAKTYGNWTRFVNHMCVLNNVMTRRVMYGKRLVMAFIAKTDIQPGDQLFSSYGRQYFVNTRNLCRCTDWAQDGTPHLPPTVGDLEVAGRLPARAPDVIDTLANLRRVRNVGVVGGPVGGGNEAVTFRESRTFEIDVSAGGSFVTTREFVIPRSALEGAGGNRTIDIDLVLRRRGGRGGGVMKPTEVKKAVARRAVESSTYLSGGESGGAEEQ